MQYFYEYLISHPSQSSTFVFFFLVSGGLLCQEPQRSIKRRLVELLERHRYFWICDFTTKWCWKYQVVIFVKSANDSVHVNKDSSTSPVYEVFLFTFRVHLLQQHRVASLITCLQSYCTFAGFQPSCKDIKYVTHGAYKWRKWHLSKVCVSLYHPMPYNGHTHVIIALKCLQ